MQQKIRNAIHEALAIIGKEIRDSAVFIILAVIVAALLVAVGAVHVQGSSATTSAPSARIVTIDPVELANAERALASKLLTRHGNHPAARRRITLKLFRVGREMRATIRKVAGPGTIVLVKQAVIAGSVPDITKTVLTRLGLPAKVPTVDLTQYLTHGVAATTMSLSQLDAALRARAKKQEQRSATAFDAQQRHAAAHVIP